MKEPLSPNEARKLVAKLYGEMLFLSPHAQDRMADHNIIEVDVVNVLRNGHIPDPAEFENGSWRYRVAR
jgi:muramidase (phage lysozyme)